VSSAPRERVVVVASLALLCVLASLYTILGAGMGMSAWDMTTFTLFPHQHVVAAPDINMAAPSGVWHATTWLIMIAMWWVMMIAMMTPSATPAVLLFSRVQRHAATRAQIEKPGARIAVFIAGYLLLWLAFAIAATLLHFALERAGLLSAMMMQSRSKWLSGAFLILAGAYQLSPLKNMCLAHCHSPAAFLSRHARPGIVGALRVGALHGIYCIGCCWLLMALLYVGGVMNLAWIAALAVLVMLEKVLRAGPWVARMTGIVLLAWGAATLVV
jgi:predicted metal-binding membrane protein